MKAFSLFICFLFFGILSASQDCFLVILVDAPQLDYTNCNTLIRTIAKHPSNGSKCGDVGHAWIYLQWVVNGQTVVIEGGHSGELGFVQPKYFDGVMDRIESGERNPISYLWEIQKDGFFQRGCGWHTPTYAVAVALTQERFACVLRFIRQYSFREYSLWGNQCCSFVTQIASLVGISLECQAEICIPSNLKVGNNLLPLWQDPEFSVFSFASPDVLEQSLCRAVSEGRAQPALNWYLVHHRHPLCCRITRAFHTCINFPKRIIRWLYFY